MEAESAVQIEREFPELRVVSQPPEWMTPERAEKTRNLGIVDIDDRATGFLAELLSERGREERLRQKEGRAWEHPLILELRRFIRSYAEHDPDCPGLSASGPAVSDLSFCNCGLTERERELLRKVNIALQDRRPESER